MKKTKNDLVIEDLRCKISDLIYNEGFTLREVSLLFEEATDELYHEVKDLFERVGGEVK